MLFLVFIYNYTPINLNQTTIHIWIVNAKPNASTISSIVANMKNNLSAKHF